MLRWERWRAELTGARAFCVRDGGRPVAMCLLLATPHADEVERVYTAPSHRGRGLAYAVVARALHEAGDKLTFLFTDAHGAAQHLYARLGFRRAWTVYRFLRPPAQSDRPAHVARERGVADDPDVPRERRLRRGGHGDVGDPARAVVVERGELVGRERPAEAAAQLVVDLARHGLEQRLLLRRRLVQPPLTRLPLLQVRLERHRGEASYSTT